ncbi:MAG: YcgN family cysteine cluster protein [Rhodospirillales bacterium]|jgi:hypothetical protein|nr:YcgN family cysteine cluster protein [Rhodospirillales bacterium]MDP6884846.1 YcgN family cysteine cluster protein [Rhodospirillales bacterium]
MSFERALPTPPGAEPNQASGDKPFWRRKSLAEMTPGEWESLCDGCAKCCLHKLEDARSGEISCTNVACRLLDIDTCRCTDYSGRSRLVDDCVRLDPGNVSELTWMPSSCAYRLVAEGKDLPGWHPLVSGDPGSVHRAGRSVKGRVVFEEQAGDLWDHVVKWPE